MAVQVRTLEVYDDLEIVAEALQEGLLMRRARGFMGPGRDICVTFKDLPGKYPGMLIFPQFQNEDLLLRKLKDVSGHSPGYNTKLIDFEKKPNEGYIEAKLENTATMEIKRVKAKYIVGCDGAHSAVRHSLKLPFEGKRYADDFMLCDCTVEIDKTTSGDYLQPGESLFYNDERMVVLFPYKEPGTYRIIATRMKEAEGKEVTLEQIQEACEKLPIPVKLSNPTWLTAFSLHARSVNQYADNSCKVFVAGDAAHIHSPVGGQGMNTGLQDAYNLGWKLAMTLEGVASDSLLRTYNEERHPIGTKLLQTTDRAFSTVAGTGNLFKIVRAILFSPVGKKLVLPRLMELAPQWASQLGINYRSSSLAMSQLPLKLWGSWPLVGGDRLPYFSFYNQKEEERSTFDFVRGPHWTYILLAKSAEELASATPVPSILHKLDLKCKAIITHGSENEAAADSSTMESIIPNPELVRVKSKDQADFIKAFGLCSGVILTRPDGYVGYIEAKGQESKLEEYLLRIVQKPVVGN
jgi:2-polyprenyl-6-methoxyphenol hydroxylase-like FAD-dependent oxidoreductase